MEPIDLVSPYKEMAEAIGISNTFKIYEQFRGQQLNMPQRIVSTLYVESYIRDNYDGTNLKEFAKMFNYSERRIRQFLKNNKCGGDTDGSA